MGEAARGGIETKIGIFYFLAGALLSDGDRGR
jgi:hypothetical protein